MKKSIILLTLIAIIGIGLLGFFAGKKLGREQTQEKFSAVLNMAYPAPPQNLTTTGGTITDIYGNRVTIDMIDPEDYLPHPDGSPHKKIEREVKVDNQTKIQKIDYSNPQPDGTPAKTELDITDLRKNQEITIYTKENLRPNKEVTATQIKLYKY